MLLKTLCTKEPFADVFKINVHKIWRSSTLLKRDSNTGVFLWMLRNFYEQLFYRTPPLAASAVNFTLYFQVVLRLYNSNTWIVVYIPCSSICSFFFCNFSFARRDFNFDWLFFMKLIWWNGTCAIFSKFDQTKMRQALHQTRMLKSLMFLFAVFCKIVALECNAYWFHV